MKINFKNIRTVFHSISTFLQDRRDVLWLLIWLCGIMIARIWTGLYLNSPALRQIETAFFNSVFISFVVLIFVLLFSWLTTNALYFLEIRHARVFRMIIVFFLNLLRSLPQIVGVLIGYIILTAFIETHFFSSGFSIILSMALILSLFIFPEMVDLFLERIAYFRRLDFFNAMLVCGIRESRIVNREILLKNSPAHILNKLIAVFGIAIFLQCSIDFIISVGLSTEINALNFPITLGRLLAKIDSKQDILAIGYSITNPGYIPNIFFKHLQGVTVAFLIVFTLLCLYHISKGYARRYKI